MIHPIFLEMLLKGDAGLPGKHILAALIFITQPSKYSLTYNRNNDQVVINGLRKNDQWACNKSQPDDFSWRDGLYATGGNVMGHAPTCRILLRKAGKTCIAIWLIHHIMRSNKVHDSRRRAAEEYSKGPYSQLKVVHVVVYVSIWK